MMHPHGMHGHHQPPHQPPHQLHPHHQPHPHHGHPLPPHQQHHPHHHPHHQQPHPLPHHQQHHALHQQQPIRQLHQHQPQAQQQPQQQQPQQQHHMQPALHRDQPRILAGPIGQTGGGNMNMGLGMRVRVQRCPAPPPQITVMQSRSRLPPSTQLHRLPPPSHHLQSSLSTPTTTSTPQPSSVTTNSVSTTTSGSLSTVSQQQTQSTVSTNGLSQFSIKPSTTMVSDMSKTEIIIPSDPGNGVNGSKEKTPMCLVNELARFNKIQHQYRLTSEQGPAHRRRFTVALRLGDGDKENVEEYTAEAPRIRAAQHAVAAEALRSTNFPRPPPRPPRALRNRRTNGSVTIMPTVELNALAMKLGEPTVYKLEHHPPQIGQTLRNGPVFSVPFRPRGPHPTLGPPPSMHLQTVNRNGRFYSPNGRFFNQNNRFAYPYNKLSNTGYREPSPYEDLYRVKLTVGSRVFRGEGSTPQAARHDAAARALQELKNSEKDECEEKDQPSCQDVDSDDKSCSDVKSPVSMVHEIALKFNLPATFSVKSEKGPPHMKVFTTTCTVGEHVTEGDGNSKKISKKRAAEKMLEELKKLPTFKKTVAQPKIQKPKRKPQQPKKKTRNLIKEKGETTVVLELNPVSRLLQWSNTRSGGFNNEPSYTLVEEARGQWRRGFLIQCEVAGHQTKGAGPNKKLAKRNAAENMLVELGLGKTPSPGVSPKSSPESSVEKQSETNKSPRKVTFSLENSKLSNSEGISPNATGRQLVPGVLLMQDYLSSPLSHFKTPTKNGVNVQTTATIAKELLRAGTSPTADALAKEEQHIGINSNNKPISSSVISSTTSGNVGNSQTSQVIRPKDQLLYLAKLLNFQVQFSDFPKGNHGEFLSLVTLSTEPPMVCHGGGLTTEQSHDQSARAALENLSQMGLDSVTPHSGSGRSGDGINSLSGNSASMPSILTNGITK